MSRSLLEQLVKEVTKPIIRKRIKWGRNWLCLCNSGKKYKRCCLNKIDQLTASDGNSSLGELHNDIGEVFMQDKEATRSGGFHTDIEKSLGIPDQMMHGGNGDEK